MTRADACKVAGDLFEHLLGTQPTDYDTSMQSAYSVRRHAVIREWSVLCSTPDGEYLLRINADTRRVYAINRMDDLLPPVPSGDSDVAADDVPEARMSHNQAEARAREYIGLIGIQPRSLTPIVPRLHNSAEVSTELSEPEWNFTFENATKQKNSHLVTISVRSTDGRLEHLWNPVLSL